MNFGEEKLDYLNLRVFGEKFNKKELFVFLPYNGSTQFYRLELGEHPQELFRRELYESKEEIREKARALSEKQDENMAVILVEDALDIPFPGELEEKLSTALIMYYVASDMHSKGEPTS